MDEVMGSQWWAKQVRLMGLTVEWWGWNHLIRQQDAGQIHRISISAEIQAKTARYKVPWERLLPSDDWLACQASANCRSSGLNQKLKVKSRVPGKPMPLVLALSLITCRELGCPEIQILGLPLIRPFLSSLKQIWIRTGDYLVCSFRIMCPSPVSRSGEEWDSHWLLVDTLRRREW